MKFIYAIVIAFALASMSCGTTGQQIRTDINQQCGSQNTAAYNALKAMVMATLTGAAQNPFESTEAALIMLAQLIPAGVPAVVCMVKVVVHDLRTAAPTTAPVQTLLGGPNAIQAGIDYGERFVALHASDK